MKIPLGGALRAIIDNNTPATFLEMKMKRGAIAIGAVIVLALGGGGTLAYKKLVGPSAEEIAKKRTDSVRAEGEQKALAEAKRREAERHRADSVRQKQVADSIKAHPCPTEKFHPDATTGFMTLAALQKFLAGHACDPYKSMFDSTGAFRAISEEERHTPLVSMFEIARNLQVLKDPWELMPANVQRALLPPAMKMIAGAIAPYVHRKETTRYLLALDWTRDIETVNPRWLNEGIQWDPGDVAMDTAMVDITGYGKVSRSDVWVRMFWKRRGREMFEAAKSAFGQALQPPTAKKK